jgi:hypothetical protein
MRVVYRAVGAAIILSGRLYRDESCARVLLATRHPLRSWVKSESVATVNRRGFTHSSRTRLELGEEFVEERGNDRPQNGVADVLELLIVYNLVILADINVGGTAWTLVVALVGESESVQLAVGDRWKGRKGEGR